MKRTVSGLSCIVALLFLLFSAIVGVMFVNFAKANPVWPRHFPIEPVKTPPTITFQSPAKHQIYDSNSVWLNFTIVKPESWFLLTNEVSDEQGNPVTFIVVNITSVSYTIDGVTNTSIPVHDLTRLSTSFPNRSLNFSINLTLPEGVHNVKVGFEAESFYVDTVYFTAENATGAYPAGVRIFDVSLSSVMVNGSSDTIRFSVAGSFPTALVIAPIASVAVVGVGLLVYFKKRNH